MGLLVSGCHRAVHSAPGLLYQEPGGVAGRPESVAADHESKSSTSSWTPERMQVGLYVCMSTCIHICTYVHYDTYVHVCTYVQYLFMHALMYYVRVWVVVSVYMYLFINMHVCIFCHCLRYVRCAHMNSMY